MDLAFAGVHQLHWPLLDRVEDPPGPLNSPVGFELDQMVALSSSSELVG
ncbi:MAG TPA: hypothetical protein VN886_14420 [Acidimicrobiales bacterium]|nr:hypothetical protein [Acidimicrobiales bacterium]